MTIDDKICVLNIQTKLSLLLKYNSALLFFISKNKIGVRQIHQNCVCNSQRTVWKLKDNKSQRLVQKEAAGRNLDHVPVRSLNPNSHELFNYKQFFSLSIQVAHDYRGYFMNVESMWPERVHDANVFAISAIKKKWENEKLRITFQSKSKNQVKAPTSQQTLDIDSTLIYVETTSRCCSSTWSQRRMCDILSILIIKLFQYWLKLTLKQRRIWKDTNNDFVDNLQMLVTLQQPYIRRWIQAGGGGVARGACTPFFFAITLKN